MQHSTQPAVEVSASMSFTALKQALAAAGVPEQLLFHASDRAGLIAIAEARGLLSAHAPDSSAVPPSSTSVASIVASHRLSRANERASPRLQSSTLVARKDQEIAQKDQEIAQKDQEIEELRSKVEMLRRATPADVGSEPSQAPAGTAKSGAASASAASAANAAMTSSARSESANAVATEQDTGTSSRSWDIDAWIQSLGVHELISACVMPPKGTDHFAYAKGLTAKMVASKLSDCRLVETLAGAIARGAVALLEQNGPGWWDDGVDGGLLCHLLLGMCDDPVHGRRMLRFRCRAVPCHKLNMPHYRGLRDVGARGTAAMPVVLE